MFKRLVALLLLAALLVPSAVQAEESFATYRLPEGAETVPVNDIHQLDVPEGMESMYHVMGRASRGGDTYIARMKNGQVLASVSRRKLNRDLTLDDLLAMSPQILAALYQDFAYVQEESAEFEIAASFGQEALNVYALVGVEKPEEFAIVGTAFPADGVMYEVWSISPADTSRTEVQSDLEDVGRFFHSLDFITGETVAVSYSLMDERLSNLQLPQSRQYTDAENRFSVCLPLDSQILTSRSTPEEREAIRQEYLSLNEAGAERVFDSLMEDIDQGGATVVFCNEYQSVVKFFCQSEPVFAGLNTAGFLVMGDVIAQSLMDKYDLALCLSANQAVTLSGREHCLLRFGTREDELSQYMTMMAHVDDEGLLREIDIITSARQGQNGANVLLALLAQTLQYE